MQRLFISTSKGEELRFLGHLDFLRTMERAVVRSEIPIGFSAGFNPHMKIAFDTALGVGVTADPLYMEIKMEDLIPFDILKKQLQEQLPKGITIHHIVKAEEDFPKLPVFFTEDSYKMEGPIAGAIDFFKMEEEVRRFNSLDTFLYKRVTPKKVREMNVKPMILEPISVRIEKERAHLAFSLIRTFSGTVQPKDMWKLLAESFSMPWSPGEFICSRTGAYKRRDGVRYTLFDVLKEGNK